MRQIYRHDRVMQVLARIRRCKFLGLITWLLYFQVRFDFLRNIKGFGQMVVLEVLLNKLGSRLLESTPRQSQCRRSRL
jgi:hypothetical protein